jgi:hypothetical protein
MKVELLHLKYIILHKYIHSAILHSQKLYSQKYHVNYIHKSIM